VFQLKDDVLGRVFALDRPRFFEIFWHLTTSLSPHIVTTVSMHSIASSRTPHLRAISF
jgi:alkyl hydroperoxide reductase subunit AhpF